MIQPNYQKTKEDFESYLKSRQFSTKSIRSSMVVFNQYLQWLDQQNVEPEQVSYNDLLMFMKYCSNTGKTQRTIGYYMTVIRHSLDLGTEIEVEKLSISPFPN